MSLKEITLKNSIKVLELDSSKQIKGGCWSYNSSTTITLSSGGGTPPPIKAIVLIGH